MSDTTKTLPEAVRIIPLPASRYLTIDDWPDNPVPEFIREKHPGGIGLVYKANPQWINAEWENVTFQHKANDFFVTCQPVKWSNETKEYAMQRRLNILNNE